MKKLKLIQIAGLLLAGLLTSANGFAYYVSGSSVLNSSDVDSGDYIGYIGNVNVGLSSIGVSGISPDAITTKYISDGSGGYTTFNPVFDGATTHWYQFSTSIPDTVVAHFELGTDVTSFTASFFIEGGSDTAIPTTFLSGTANDFWISFSTTYVGNILMKLDLDGSGSNQNYDATLYATAVPLPPAALLFISALAGFGVIGRRKSSKA